MKYDVRPIRNDDERQACFDIRHTVFVEEQNVPVSLERDAYDLEGSTHFIALAEGVPLGTGRLRIVGDQAKIQRVAVLSVARGAGLGAQLMRAMEAHVRSNNLAPAITLGAQIHAMRFYERLGYAPHGPEFDDAGIAHVEMRKILV